MKSPSYMVNLIVTQSKFELIKLWRMPVYIITLLGLPLFFYAATGTNHAMPELTEGLNTKQYLVCTLGTFSVFGISLFGSGVSFSIERGQGWYHSLQPTPVPTWSIFISKIIACLVITILGVLLLFSEAIYIFKVSMPLISWIGILLTLVFGALPLCCLGLLIGSLTGANSSPLVTIMVYLGISSVSGLLATLSMIRMGNPELADMAVIYPTYHVAQLALGFLKNNNFNKVLNHLGVLLLYTLGFVTITMMVFRESLKRTNG